MLRIAVLALALAAPVVAQLPRGFYAWWNSPVVQDLNLNDGQRRQIRLTVKAYRPHLMDLRAQVERAEADLEFQFNQPAVDPRRANQAIDRLAAARSDLTRTLSQMSLQLRAVLSQRQWQELQRRRPLKGGVPLPPTEESPSRR